MLYVTTNIRGVDDNIIQIYLHKFHGKVSQYILHYFLEHTISINEAHRHH